MAEESYSSESSLKRKLDIHSVGDAPGDSFLSNFMTGRRGRVISINPTTENPFCIKRLKGDSFRILKARIMRKKIVSTLREDGVFFPRVK